MSESQRIAVYPGTFDPITLGHLDVIKASTAIFDEIVVALLINPRKKALFSEKERLAMIEESIQEADLAGVRTTSFDGLAVELARQEHATAIIRGLRLVTDYEAELELSFNNRILSPEIHTVFIPPTQEHVHISSSIVRELLAFEKADLLEYVPKAVLKHLSRQQDKA